MKANRLHKLVQHYCLQDEREDGLSLAGIVLSKLLLVILVLFESPYRHGARRDDEEQVG